MASACAHIGAMLLSCHAAKRLPSYACFGANSPTTAGEPRILNTCAGMQETALDELEAGQEALQVAGSERTDQLKALVKQNFERFISCKTTIDDVHVRLRGAEVGGRGASGGASTEDVSKAVAAVCPHGPLWAAWGLELRRLVGAC